MALTIGLIYDKDENWIAGSYYIENLVSAMTTLGDEDKPHLKIYTRSQSTFDKLVKTTGYPLVAWVPLVDSNNLLDRLLNKVSYTFFRTHWRVRGIDRRVDILFPAADSFYFDRIRSKLYWIPDFQEMHYAHFFPMDEVEKRKRFQKKLVRDQSPIVFSSENAKQDFYTLYPQARNKVFVMPFAVTLPDASSIKINQVRSKFNIPDSYFMCSNQFWAHKNHMVILKAILNLKSLGIDVSVVFTGKPFDNRNPDYYPSLTTFIEEHQLHANVRFLGFIDRVEQIALLKHCEAVIQPSSFEGWSTIIEDAKALQIPIIASNIAVHREQLPAYPYLFPKDNADALADMLVAVKNNPPKFTPYREVEAFGKRFIQIVKEVLK